MADSLTSAAARALVQHRWGNRVAVRSAQLTIERVDELPADLKAVLHEVTGPQAREGGSDD